MCCCGVDGWDCTAASCAGASPLSSIIESSFAGVLPMSVCPEISVLMSVGGAVIMGIGCGTCWIGVGVATGEGAESIGMLIDGT
jgi:hypothetical protein